MFTWIIWSKHDLIVNMPVDMSIDVAFLLLAFKVRVYKSDSSFSNRLCLLSLSFSLSVDFSFICLFQVQPHVYSDGSFRWTFDNIWLQNYCNKKYFRSCERIRDSPKWYHIVDLFLNFLICAKIFLKGEGTFFSLPFGCRGNQKNPHHWIWWWNCDWYRSNWCWQNRWIYVRATNNGIQATSALFGSFCLWMVFKLR